MKRLRVFVYRNLHKDCFSIRDMFTGRVVAHSTSLWLEDCEFRVGKTGSEKVKKTGRKNVHAGIVGYLVLDPFRFLEWEFGLPVFYDPSIHSEFVNADGETVKEARVVLCQNNKVFIEGVRSARPASMLHQRPAGNRMESV